VKACLVQLVVRCEAFRERIKGCSCCCVWRLLEEEMMQKGCFSTACKAWFDAVVVALKYGTYGTRD
jgi:hypothetical protein